jgi:hypothetical protein
MSASLAFQTFARTALAGSVAVTALVPASNIVDANARPEAFPRINLGEDQEQPADDVVGRFTALTSTMHVWSREPGLAVAKAIADAVKRTLRLQVWTLGDYRCIDCKFSSARFIRDPDGITAHGIVTFDSLIEELA